MIMVVMVIEGMDGVSANHSCEWKRSTHKQDEMLSKAVIRMKSVEVNTHMHFSVLIVSTN